MYKTIVRALLSCVLAIPFLGCEDEHDSQETYAPPGNVERLIWDTTGVGDLKFSIVQGPDQFEISVQRYNSQAANDVILLTNADLEAYQLVDDIFSGRIDLHDYTYAPIVAPDTWTDITLVSTEGQAEEIVSILLEALSPLYDFVRDRMEQTPLELRIDELIWDTTGAGDLKFSIVQGPDQFEISVKRYNFQVADQVILLTNADLEVYELVGDIFSERIDIHDYAFVPAPGTGGGSLTTIRLTYPGELEDKVEDVNSRGGLSALYDFVSDHMDTSE